MNQPVQARPRSVALILLCWCILQVGGLFSPGLLDDVDSVYIEVAREMLHRHDFVTPAIDGIRFFDKPPLMYWLAAGSMRLFGEHDWAARIPLTLAVLALLLATYALGKRFFGERGGLYAALALGTSIGPYLYTRFYIPDLPIALCITLSIHLFLIALDRARSTTQSARYGIREKDRHPDTSRSEGEEPLYLLSSCSPTPINSRHPERSAAQPRDPEAADVTTSPRTLQPSKPASPSPTDFRHPERSEGPLYLSSSIYLKSPLLPTVLFALTLTLNLLTKGLIGLVFPLAFVFLYLLLTRQARLLRRLPLLPAAAVFLLTALPWHILAALRNPATSMPPGLGLPAKAGWAWFYLYNEHIARFLGRRIPHDYGNTPVWLFWLYTLIWIMPWGAFLPAAFVQLRRDLGHHFPVTFRQREAALTLTLWAAVVLVFFSISNRQEYYSLPALPALALMVGGALASARTARAVLLCHRWLLLPLSLGLAAVCAWFALTAPHPPPGVDLATLLSTNQQLYNVSLGHLFDLTTPALGLFRVPLVVVAVGMLILGPGSYVLRLRNAALPANLILAAGMTLVLLAAHTAFVRFNPILGSKLLAEAILVEQAAHPVHSSDPPDQILIDGELTSGSTLLFYTRQSVSLVNGRINGPWFGSFWPDALPIFKDEAGLRVLWSRPARVFLFTRNAPAHLGELPHARILASAGGKTILVNR